MNINKQTAKMIVADVAELADLASYRDIGVAEMILRSVAQRLGIDPMTIPQYVEISKL